MLAATFVEEAYDRHYFSYYVVADHIRFTCKDLYEEARLSRIEKYEDELKETAESRVAPADEDPDRPIRPILPVRPVDLGGEMSVAELALM